jgi:hypothetical protein
MQSIARLIRELPLDYEADCFKEKAMERTRGIASPADLMMLVMFHLHSGCSLIDISQIAKISGLGNVSDVAFMKRFAKCGEWFKAINKKLISNKPDLCDEIIQYEKPNWMQGKDVLGLDASDVSEKGCSGRIYRLHFALNIFDMQSYEQSITTTKTGESLTNFELSKDCIVIADRIYSSIKGIEHCVDKGANYILRLRKNSFTPCDENGNKINLLDHFNQLSDDECLDINAYVINASKVKIPIRICARRKTADAIEQSYKKLRRKESKKQITISDGAKIFNEYIVVVTNVESTAASSKEILDAYRFRWQVEIYFKRLKSILNFGELPKRNATSSLAWLNGKLMIALLIEIVIAKASFSPQENEK